MDRPILFSGPMIRALLAGTKTQTRRIVKPQPPAEAKDAGVIGSGDPASNGLWWWLDSADLDSASTIGAEFRCPYGASGDRLWVRETWCPSDTPTGAAYRADAPIGSDQRGMGWRPSIHMPRKASRLWLDVTEVRVQRLQDISAEDADAECFDGGYPEKVLPEVFPQRDGGWGHLSIPECYGRLWDHINGAGAWGANPWVWAVSFEGHQGNLAMLKQIGARV